MMGLFGNQQQAGGMSPVVKALLLALAVKAAQSYMAQRSAGTSAAQPGVGGGPAAAPQGGLGGLLGGLLGGGGGGGGLGSILGGGASGGGGLGGLGGMLGGGGGGLGGLLGGLGGAGGLGALVSHLTNNGQGDAVKSWIAPGANQPISPQALGSALGEDHVAELEQHTGLPRDALLSQLAAHLPEAISAITPNGQLPSEDELSRMVAH